MSAEERQAFEESEAAIEAATNKFKEAKRTDNMKMFIEWVNENYVPQKNRKDLPEQQEGKKGSAKFGRWVVSNVSKWIHPDKFVGAPKAKQIEVGEVLKLVNDVVNKLKGIEN